MCIALTRGIKYRSTDVALSGWTNFETKESTPSRRVQRFNSPILNPELWILCFLYFSTQLPLHCSLSCHRPQLCDRWDFIPGIMFYNPFFYMMSIGVSIPAFSSVSDTWSSWDDILCSVRALCTMHGSSALCIGKLAGDIAGIYLYLHNAWHSRELTTIR